MYLTKHSMVGESYKKAILSFVIIAVLLILIVIYFSSGKAAIKVTPAATPVGTDFVADVATDGGPSGSGVLQGVLSEAVVSGDLTGDATGYKALPGNSVGKVVIYNKRSESQTLVKTTRLLSLDNVLLRMSERATIPANGQAEVSVYPDNPNSFAELGPTSFKIPGLVPALQDKVYAESKSILKSAGSSIKVIQAVDIARAQDELSAKLVAKAVADFKAQLPNADYFAVAAEKQVIETLVSEKADAVRDNFTVSMKLKVALVGLNQKSIEDTARERLRAVVPDGKALTNLDAAKFTYLVQNFDNAKKTMNLKVHAEGLAVITAENDIFDRAKLTGLSPKGVELYLSNFDEIKAVRVQLSPFWVAKVPKMESHITVEIEKPI
ncbi:MAG: hypothetical protein V1928_00425 [Parcubacteria group bacterium]